MCSVFKVTDAMSDTDSVFKVLIEVVGCSVAGLSSRLTFQLQFSISIIDDKLPFHSSIIAIAQ